MNSSASEVLSASTFAALLIESALKGCVLLILAFALSPGLRRLSAARRHAVWLGVVCGLLALPGLSCLLPGLSWLPSWCHTSVQPVRAANGRLGAEVESSGASLGRPRDAGESQVLERSVPPRPAPLLQAQETTPPESGGTDAAHPISGSMERPPNLAGLPAMALKPNEPGPAANPRPRNSLEAKHWILIVWAGGAALALLPLLLGARGLRRLARGARAMTQPTHLDVLRRLCRQLQMKGEPRLLEHPDRQMPMTWGFRPVILLPQGSENWPEARLRLVLLHELAHIKRHDFHARLLTRLACALYWFNPLVWRVAGRIGAEQEKASDDMVLKCGTPPADYVEQVLDMVSQLRTSRVASYQAVGLGEPSNLEQRLRAVLDESRSRAPLTTKVLVLTLIALSSILFPVAMLRAQSTDPKSASPEPAKPSAPDRPRPFVRLVVGQDRMTFEGKDTGWAALAGELRMVQDRAETVLEVAVDSDEFTLRKLAEVQAKAGALSKQWGFKNLSYVGIQPLGSKGSTVAPKDAVELAQAELAGDAASIERIRLRLAREQLQNAKDAVELARNLLADKIAGPNATEVALPKMAVARISPLNFTINLERVVNPGQYYIGITREAAEKPANRKKKQRFATINAKNEFFTLKEIQGPPEDPTSLVLQLENRELATVSKNNPYNEVEGYEADLRSSIDGESFPRLRVDSTFRFEGEVYDVIVVTRNEVVVRARSNERKYRVPMAAAPRSQSLCSDGSLDETAAAIQTEDGGSARD